MSDSGIAARGSIADGPIPLNRLLIFKRDSDQLQMIDGLSEDGRLAAIEWKGIFQIESNRKLILFQSDLAPRKRAICGD